MAGGSFQKNITFLAAGLLIMMLAVNVSEAAIGTDCTTRGNKDCAAGNNEVCTSSGCACGAEFTDNSGTCDLICPALTNPTDGAVSVSFVTATYTCNTGFTVTGGPTQTCTSGSWVGTAATCPLACTAQTAPSNGAVSMSTNVATFTCTSGYTLSGSGTMTCNTDTTWTGTTPTCPQACTAQTNPSNGAVTMSANVATFTCTSGYTLSGPGTMTCNTDTTWTGTTPTCPQDCPALTNPTDGAVSVSFVTATYTCNTGFTVTGGPTQTCTTGTWVGIAATCVLACTAQQDPSNGTVSTSANVATFNCTNGYTLSGSNTLTCNTNTNWSGSAPTCSAVLGRTCTTISNCSSVPNAVCASSSVCGCQSGYEKKETTCAVISGGGPGVSNSLVGISITLILTALAM